MGTGNDDPLRDLIGRRFEFKRTEKGIIPARELPSSTWFHPDGTISQGEYSVTRGSDCSEEGIKILPDNCIGLIDDLLDFESAGLPDSLESYGAEEEDDRSY